MKTSREVAQKILQIGKEGFTSQEDGFKKIEECVNMIDGFVNSKYNLLIALGTVKARIKSIEAQLEKKNSLVEEAFHKGELITFKIWLKTLENGGIYES